MVEQEMVRKPADANRVKLAAGAQAERVKLEGDAEAHASQAKGCVEAAANPFGDIDQLIVLNGAQGISDALAQALSQGIAGLQLARRLLSEPGASPAASANGSRNKEDDLPPLTPRPLRGGEEGEKV